ncbi:GH25 family lysozyme [Blautia sp. MSJ-19]|uniref:GH25 family lysozyme n=1 Tax=Blautia sp. MSJ-19 TaxID=2841517 RepID=UPI00209F4A70|nr:GH25 family lysozyme [Blautia sp. MSJ-19]
MELKGIDVSAHQGKINWDKVAAYGMDFVMLRITEMGNVVDSYFETNYAACNKYNIPVGVYKYSYAMTITEIQSEARKVVSTLNGRKIQYPVWLDLEYHNQRTLGAESIHKMADAFREIVEAAGYKFGIYCNLDWYTNMICSHLKKYDFWIARYPTNDNGTLQERLRPDFGVGWQYSSKATIPGISTKVDRNIFYKNYVEEQKKEETAVATTDKLKEFTDLGDLYAGEETGKPYLEKATLAYLDDFQKNAGYNNYTKFARDVNSWGQPGCQGQPWCAVYQFWKLVKVFGLTKALQIMGGGFYNCQSVTRHAKQKGTWKKTPKKGALIIFRNGSHIGSVRTYDTKYVYTNEGNTSSAAGVVANGGACRNKKYKLTDSAIDGYVWIDYGTKTDQASTETAKTLNTKPKFVGKVTATELNVRSWAGAENPKIKKWPLLKKGNLVDVCDTVKAADGSDWYYIRIDGKYYGFVAARYIQKQ